MPSVVILLVFEISAMRCSIDNAINSQVQVYMYRKVQCTVFCCVYDLTRWQASQSCVWNLRTLMIRICFVRTHWYCPIVAILHFFPCWLDIFDSSRKWICHHININCLWTLYHSNPSQARDQYFVVGLVNYGFTCSGEKFTKTMQYKNHLWNTKLPIRRTHHHHHHRGAAGSVCEHGRSNCPEFHHICIQTRFLW